MLHVYRGTQYSNITLTFHSVPTQIQYQHGVGTVSEDIIKYYYYHKVSPSLCPLENEKKGEKNETIEAFILTKDFTMSTMLYKELFRNIALVFLLLVARSVAGNNTESRLFMTEKAGDETIRTLPTAGLM